MKTIKKLASFELKKTLLPYVRTNVSNFEMEVFKIVMPDIYLSNYDIRDDTPMKDNKIFVYFEQDRIRGHFIISRKKLSEPSAKDFIFKETERLINNFLKESKALNE